MGATRKLLPAPERRAALMKAAKEAFAARGFAGTSMDDVAAAAGVSRLIVYRHFESKEALYDAVASETGAMLDAALHAATDTPGFAAIGALLTVARADPQGYRVLWEHVAREPQFEAHLLGFRDPAVGFVRALLAGVGLTGTRLTWASETLLAFAVEAVTHWVEIEPPERDEEFLELMRASLPRMIEAWVR